MLALCSSSSLAFTVGAPLGGVALRTASPSMADMANGKMTFGDVKREWRCKWADDGTGKASSPALVAIADVVDEFLPKIKELEGVKVDRQVRARPAHASAGASLAVSSSRGPGSRP